MKRFIHKIETEDAPKPNGPYSQAVATEEFLFVAGQIPIEPKSGEIIDKTIQGQTNQVLDNIEAILKAAGLSLESVVKVEVYLKNMDDYHAVNEIYTHRFSHPIKPARQMMQVARLPRDSLIEISCIAFKKPKSS